MICHSNLPSSLLLPRLVQQLSHIPAGGSSLFQEPSEQLLLWVPLEQLEGQDQLSPPQRHSSLWPRDLIQPISLTAAFILQDLCTGSSPCLSAQGFPPSLLQFPGSLLNAFLSTQPAGHHITFRCPSPMGNLLLLLCVVSFVSLQPQ